MGDEDGGLAVFLTSRTNSVRNRPAVDSSSAENCSSQSRIAALVANARAIETR
jgi:hypothetical protein